MPKRMTHEEFVSQLQLEHPNLEVLSTYNGNKNYVTVRCKIHDYTFQSKPNWLHAGHGCQKCYDERRGNSTRKTLDEYIKTVTDVHNGKYDYSQLTEYKNIHTKIPVICPKHGLFYIDALHHQRGQGCSKCASERNGFNKRLPSNLVFQRCKEKHGNKYTYDENSYESIDNPITIYCPIHGEFKQIAYCHMNGSGCPRCNASHLENDVKKLLNDNSIAYISQYRCNELGLQSLDFYLPDYNIAIECQGGQHFFSVEHFGGETEFNKVLKRDKTKFDVCKKKGIRLIYIVPNNLSENLQKLIKSKDSIYSNENSFILEKINKIENLLL